jgi:hypothetical protein
MTVIVKHNKTNTITDWTQAYLNEQIALGNYPPGTLLADIVLPSDWNNDHTLTGLGTMAEQNANSVAITGGTINNTTIGATTASTGTFTTLIGGANVANYGQLTGGATTKAVEFVALGTDSNISIALDSKGTGAIDLAAGSSGVNISNGGTVTAITRTAGGSGYATAPTVAISAPTTAGGVQATATCTVTAGAVNTTFTITNAGSGYIEQPTITFSGGGGSGAAAYATVGSFSTIKSIGSGTSSFGTNTGFIFQTPNTVAPAFMIREAAGADSFVMINPQTAYTNIVALGNANANLGIYANGTGLVAIGTGGTSNTTQFRVSHTTSAVNFVQVTGSATTSPPIISAQGSDTNIALRLYSKGTNAVSFWTNNGGARQFQINHTAGTIANYAQVTGNIAGSAPSFSVDGTDTNIDLALTPKGTGVVTFGTYTAGVLTPTGYVTIKDSGGTTRRLLVG